MPSDPSKSKILFLDRDGVINEDTGHPWRISDIQFISGIFQVVKRANRAGFKVVVVTNQAGIAKGLYSEQDFGLLTVWMIEEFKHRGAVIDAVEFCPHHPLGIIGSYAIHCACRKPLPGMLNRAICASQGDPSASILIGDRMTDIDAAVAAGIGTAYLFCLAAKDSKKYQKSKTNVIEISDFADVMLEDL